MFNQDEARATNGVLPEGEVAGCQALVTHRPRESISPLASTSNALVCRSTSNKVGKVGSGKTKRTSFQSRHRKCH